MLSTYLKYEANLLISLFVALLSSSHRNLFSRLFRQLSARIPEGGDPMVPIPLDVTQITSIIELEIV